MKAFIYSFLIISSFGFADNTNWSNEKPRHFLQFEGKIFQTGMDVKCTKKILDSAYIFIFDEKHMTTDTVMTSYSGNYEFQLPLNSQYLITISKKGFVSKKLHANTNVPLFNRSEHSMEFELDLYKEIKGVDISILENPVAEIKFDPKKKSFSYNRAYTEKVNRTLKSRYATYYKNQEKAKAKVIQTKW